MLPCNIDNGFRSGNPDVIEYIAAIARGAS
jgi:hypothetical protein